MRLEIPRTKLGFQAPNVPFDIATMFPCRPDFAVVMQYGDEAVGPLLDNNPDTFLTCRWYTKNTATEHSPGEIADQACGWIEGLMQRFPKLRPGAFCVQCINEPQIGQEYDDGRDRTSLADTIMFANWEYECLAAIKQRHPDWLTCCWNGSPGHSEDQNDAGYIAFELPEVRRLVESADILGLHCYWRNAGRGAQGLDDAEAEWYFQRFKRAHGYFPDKPIIINEANGDSIAALPDHALRMEAAFELKDAVRIVELAPYVLGVNFFIWFGYGHPVMYCDETVAVLRAQEFARASFEWPETEQQEEDMPNEVDWPGATWVPSPNRTSRRAGNAVSLFVLHWTAGGEQAAINHLVSPDSEASAHYVLGRAGNWVQLVREADTAWHAGDYGVNQRSIGIETVADAANPPTEAQYQALAAFLREKAQQYGISISRETVLGHREIVATQCPGSLDIERVVSMATAEQQPPDWNGPDWWQGKSDREKWLAYARLIEALGGIAQQASEALAG